MKLGRNDPCICGSGKKYKKCCGKLEHSSSVQPRQQSTNTATWSNSKAGATPVQNEINQLVALYNAGHHVELESRARLLVKQYPDFGFAWKILGVTLKVLGKDSLPALQKTTEFLPDDVEAHNNLGIALQEMGRLDKAEASYRRALQIMPNYVDTHYNLGNTLRHLGRLDEAEASYRRALQIKPDYAEVYCNLGNIMLEQGRTTEAEASYRMALRIKPDYAVAHYNLGSILQDIGCLDEAEASYRRALQIKPDCVKGYNNLGCTLKELGRLNEAEASLRLALLIEPDSAEVYGNLGNTFLDMGLLNEAEANCRRALRIKPDFAEAYIYLGNILNEMGRLSEAEASFRQALQVRPDCIEARCSLASVGKVKAGDENLMAMEAAEKAARNGITPLAGKDAMSLHFALGKSYDDTGEYEKAFPHFLEGGRLKRATFNYDTDQAAQLFDGIMRNFDAATLDRLRGGGDPSHLPIFILGMPRSGTTLTEQIIASHPEVHGAGELPDLMAIVRRDIAGAVYPDNLRLLDQARLSAWGAEYIAGLQRRAPDARRITDKMPGNFLAVGLIHLMLPHAKIIHVKRNPVDTCLSCFTTSFKYKHEHTYDLAELGRYYVGYARLMEHWRKVLPGGAFLDVQYEDIVADQEAQSRRIIEYCGLEWNAACLDFHNNKRPVSTASVTQVRQPMYQSSVERWRHYEKFLGPLLDALGELVTER